MIILRLLEPWDRPLRCYARRGPRGKLRCEREALHEFGCSGALPTGHTAIDRLGRRHWW